jgi:hypothetical protein
VRQRYETFGPFLARGAPEATEYRELHDAAWCAKADEVTREFLDTVGRWREPGQGARREPVEFAIAEEKQPAWAMRITPKV